jgi:type II secretory pathway pseudopilin PulG
MHLAKSRGLRAFSIVEVLIVVVMVGIMAAILIPQFGGVTQDAKAGAVEGALAGVRSGIAGFRSKAILSGVPPFPTISELTTVGRVLQTPIPKNPYNNLATVQAVTQAQAAARAVVGTAGWNYYVDNDADPPTAIFYANSSDVTTIPNGSGGFKTANQL